MTPGNSKRKRRWHNNVFNFFLLNVFSDRPLSRRPDGRLLHTEAHKMRNSTVTVRLTVNAYSLSNWTQSADADGNREQPGHFTLEYMVGKSRLFGKSF